MGNVNQYCKNNKAVSPLEVDTTMTELCEFSIQNNGYDYQSILNIEEVKELIDQLSSWVGMQIA